MGRNPTILKTPSEVREFLDQIAEASSRYDLCHKLGWTDARMSSVIRTLKRRGVDVPSFRDTKQSRRATARHALEPKVVPQVLAPDLPRPKTLVKGPVIPASSMEPMGHADSIVRKNHLIEKLVEHKMNITKACAEMNLDTSLYRRWVKNDVGFRNKLEAAKADMADRLLHVGITMGLGECDSPEKPDGAMLRWAHEKLAPTSRTVNHVHSGVIGHAALTSMSGEQKRAELDKLLGMRGIEAEFEVEVADIDE